MLGIQRPSDLDSAKSEDLVRSFSEGRQPEPGQALGSEGVLVWNGQPTYGAALAHPTLVIALVDTHGFDLNSHGQTRPVRYRRRAATQLHGDGGDRHARRNDPAVTASCPRSPLPLSFSGRLYLVRHGPLGYACVRPGPWGAARFRRFQWGRAGRQLCPRPEGGTESCPSLPLPKFTNCTVLLPAPWGLDLCDIDQRHDTVHHFSFHICLRGVYHLHGFSFLQSWDRLIDPSLG